MATTSGKKARKQASSATNQYEAFKEVHPLNYIQECYLEAIQNNDIVFGIGCAGTGKTFVAASYAAAQLYYKRIDRIIVTRPNIESSASMGFIPGELEEKYAPYLEPFDSVFNRTLGKGFYEYLLKEKKIEPRPLGFMRGTTFDNCIVLVDEAQNMTKKEFLTTLSRFGKNCKFILSGDPDQTDIFNSGLEDAVKRLSTVENIEIVRFLDSDIVRSKMCKHIIQAYKGS